MSLEIRIVADADEADGEERTVEVRLTVRPRAEEDPIEDSRFFAAGDRAEIAFFVAGLLERYRGSLPRAQLTSCRRCERIGDPEAEGDSRRPFVCRRCQRKAAATGGASAEGGKAPDPAETHGASGVEVLFLGTGDAFGSGGKRQAAIFLRACGRPRGVLLDAGPGCHAALRQEGLASDDLAAVVLSHFHGDHFGGFPFLELDALRSGRREPLAVFAPPGAPERIRELRNCLYRELPVRFPEEIREVLPGEQVLLPGTTGAGAAVPFPADHQPAAWAFGWTLRMGGRTIVYSGDTGFTARVVAASAAADLLIHECSSLEASRPGHTSYAELAGAAGEITARRVLLVHTGEEVLQAGDLAFERAHDGLRLMI